jgi:hypothetical protein
MGADPILGRSARDRYRRGEEFETRMALDHLRIVSECAACHQAKPNSEPALQRLHDAIRFAARHHSIDELAHAAKVVPADVRSILGPVPTPVTERARNDEAFAGFPALGSNQ